MKGQKMKEQMQNALSSLSAMVKAYFPGAMKSALLAYGEELDRLRTEVSELRSKIEGE